MKRYKRHKVKTEAPETSTSYNREQEVHDLAYYIHDRVELMHQVFSVIKYKELKAMVPASIRNISIDDLQELCTEELLGISSKRLCAILDGAEPPSDTESSSPSPPPEQMETISLDSISSDDEILSQSSNKKKKHKHRRHSKSKSKRKKSNEDDGESDRNKASRAGLTVLELLELQARARAIRAQLQQEQPKKPVSETASKEPQLSDNDDNEVEIKEEPAEVVEISSDEEKPNIQELQKSQELQNKATEEKEAAPPQQTTVTKIINNLVITVPQKTKQKIKLNRNKTTPVIDKSTSIATTQKTNDTPSVATTKTDKPTETRVDDGKTVTKKDKSKKKKKDKKNVSKDDIDNDEITLQLSDTEKMDLLEDLDRKNYDSVSSCSESSSECSSDSDVSIKDKESGLKEKDVTPENKKDCEENAAKEAEKVALEAEKVVLEAKKVALDIEKDSDADENKQKDEKDTTKLEIEDCTKKTDVISPEIDNTNKEDKMESENTVQSNTNPEIMERNIETESENVDKTDYNEKDSNTTSKDTVTEDSEATIKDIPTVALKDNKDTEKVKDTEKNLSEGELSDRESSEVEAVDLKPEVVCISDEEGDKKAKKKKKKKDKKSKKEKKAKKKSDFRESGDQNFYKDNVNVVIDSLEEIQTQSSIEVIDNITQSDAPSDNPSKDINNIPPTEIIDKINIINAEKTVDKGTKHITEEEIDKIDLTAADKTIDIETIKEEQTINKEIKSPALSDDDIEAVYEIMELSDSSCCEVECTILSKEPTASEIEALSAKIDEIERVDIITDKEIREYERTQEKDIDNIEHISWKDRYLDSKKVKKVLTTANILNALRKKNIELKNKLAESKLETVENLPQEDKKEKEAEEENILEGSIEHYNTLEALTTYVDPIKELPKDLKKDAKLLLKMYKKLLKYNDMNKAEDPNKKRKKKRKKIKKDTKNQEEKDAELITEDAVENVVSLDSKEVSTEDLGNKEDK